MEKYNWVAQGANGTICASVNKPRAVDQVCSWVYGTDKFTIVAMTRRRNPNWKESLIDLSKNDYIIKDGILMATRKHAALIHAWADGAVIQSKCTDELWYDLSDEQVVDLILNKVVELRIKPKTKTVKFRNWYATNGRVYGTYCAGECNNPDFVTWLGDWQEVEIEL